ncbi:MAG: amidohydrolase family protein [Planctomycetota bacterium]
MRRAVQVLGLPLGEALAMASRTPARFLGVDADYGSLRPGARGALVALSEDLEVVRVIG